jgi:hypothetical protein
MIDSKEENMRRRIGVLAKEFHTRDCAIQTAIGRMLAAQHDLAEPLSDRLKHLLKRLENSDKRSAAGIQLAQIL